MQCIKIDKIIVVSRFSGTSNIKIHFSDQFKKLKNQTVKFEKKQTRFIAMVSHFNCTTVGQASDSIMALA